MKVRVLGSGQDGGLPHIGCYCRVCNNARKHPQERRLGPSIAVFDEAAGFCYLVDASPDFKVQIDQIESEIRQVKREGKIPVSGILLTHAHFGHYAGLWYLGTEALNEKDVPVLCTSRMGEFLSGSRPFRQLLENGNIRLVRIRPGVEFGLDGIRVLPIQVPHRDEITDTVGFVITAAKRLIYIPDIDRWTDETITEIRKSDIALIDGTFYSKDELPSFERVPHPPVEETIDILRDSDTEVYFTHINHTNALNRTGKERREVERKGFGIACDGLTLEI